MPPTLSDLVNAIPVVQRGDVISPESHNTLRDAIVAISAELGGATGLSTATYAPAFLAVPPDPPWTLVPGVARNTGTQAAAAGWLPVELPHNARIQRLIVTGGLYRPAGPPAQMDVLLQRRLIRGGTAGTTLARISLVGPSFAQPVFDATSNYAPFGLSTAEQASAQVVNNDEYGYFVRADLLGAPAGSSISLFAIRIECRRG